MAAQQTSSQRWDRMEKQLDTVVQALTDPNEGIAVRLARVETKVDATNGSAKSAVLCAAEAKTLALNAAKEEDVDALVTKVGVNTKQITIQWWAIGVLIVGLATIAFEVIKGGILKLGG